MQQTEGVSHNLPISSGTCFDQSEDKSFDEKVSSGKISKITIVIFGKFDLRKNYGEK